MSAEKESSASHRRLSCTQCFDALWFCYLPVHQMQQYYRVGVLDNCYGKWNALRDCLYLKTKPSSELQGMMARGAVERFSDYLSIWFFYPEKTSNCTCILPLCSVPKVMN